MPSPSAARGESMTIETSDCAVREEPCNKATFSATTTTECLSRSGSAYTSRAGHERSTSSHELTLTPACKGHALALAKGEGVKGGLRESCSWSRPVCMSWSGLLPEIHWLVRLHLCAACVDPIRIACRAVQAPRGQVQFLPSTKSAI